MNITPEATTSENDVAEPEKEPQPQVMRLPEPAMDTATKSSLQVMAFVLVIAVVTYLGVILKPLLIALFLSYLVIPTAKRLRYIGLNDWSAYLTLFILVVILSVTVGHMINANALQFRMQSERYSENLRELVSGMFPSSEVRLDVLGEMVDITTDDIIEYGFGTALNTAEIGIMVFFYLLFILMSAKKMHERIRASLDPAMAKRVISIGREINQGITGYIRLKTLVSAGMALVVGAILWFFEVEYWPLWSFLFFALNFITYIGSMVACIPPIVMVLLAHPQNWFIPLVVSTLLILNRFFWIDYVEIKFSGKQLNIDPVLLLFSIAYWGYFWGPIGMVLAVPMLTSLKIVMAHFEQTQGISKLMSDAHSPG